MNRQRGNSDRVKFAEGENRIRHVIYIIKENRTYDQVFGDLGAGNSEPSLVMYGEDITPNQHRLARQFGILDNFYDSGEVSGDGHVWSTSASISDYIAKTWPIGYRGQEHTYDSEGSLLGGIRLKMSFPMPASLPAGICGRISQVTVSPIGTMENSVSRWCNAKPEPIYLPRDRPKPRCRDAREHSQKGDRLENNVGDPRGGPSPYPWPIPVLAKNVAAEVELRAISIHCSRL